MGSVRGVAARCGARPDRLPCILPLAQVLVEAFYEWKQENGGKQPYCVRLAAGAAGEEGQGAAPSGASAPAPASASAEAGEEPLMVMAGLWDVWEGPEGPLETYAIVTTGEGRACGLCCCWAALCCRLPERAAGLFAGKRKRPKLPAPRAPSPPPSRRRLAAPGLAALPPTRDPSHPGAAAAVARRGEGRGRVRARACRCSSATLRVC